MKIDAWSSCVQEEVVHIKVPSSLLPEGCFCMYEDHLSFILPPCTGSKIHRQHHLLDQNSEGITIQNRGMGSYILLLSLFEKIPIWLEIATVLFSAVNMEASD